MRSVGQRKSTMELEKHPYAVLGGGTEAKIHCPEKVLPRGKHLLYDEGEARFCNVVSGQNKMHKLFYEIHGFGPVKVIMLMGLGGTHAQFEPQLKYFGIDQPEKYTVCVSDNRGVGLSGTPTGRWKTTDLASDALQLLIQMEQSSKPGEGSGWGSMVHVVGFSMGGMAAQELVLMAPSRFASLTLISTHAGGLLGTCPPFHGFRPFLKTMGSIGGAASLDAGMELLFPPQHLDEEINPDLSEFGEHPPEIPLTTNRLKYAYLLILRARKYIESGNAPELRLEGVAKQIPAVLSHYVSWARLERIRSYKLGVLVISGEQDNLIGSWNSRILSEALCGKWLHFSDAGHGVNEQHSDAVNSSMEKLFEDSLERHRRSPHIATHRKPWPPSYHPIQLFLAVLGSALIVQRKVLPAFIPSKLSTIVSLVVAAVVLRRNYGGFFAR